MLCFNVENGNQPTHSFMKKHSDKYYSINDWPVKKFTTIIFKLFCWTTTLSWRKEIIYHVVIYNLALHIEAVNLADGEYELVPTDSRVDQEVNLNCASVAQVLGQAPEVFLPDSAQEGKPRCIIPLFTHYIHLTICICCNNFYCAFTFSRSWSKTWGAWSLGTYVCYPDLFLD